MRLILSTLDILVAMSGHTYLTIGASRHQSPLVPEQVEDGDAVRGGPPPPHGDGHDQPRRGRHLGGGALSLHLVEGHHLHH